MARTQDSQPILNQLERFCVLAEKLRPTATEGISVHDLVKAEEWAVIVAPGEKAMYLSQDGTREVRVVNYRYTPQGLMYQLEPTDPATKWIVAASAIQPVYGDTKMIRANLVTGEAEPLS